MSEQTILEVEKLCAAYGRSQVLFDLTLRVPQRGAVAVLGRNGAGKTTLMKTIVGELAVGGGAVRVQGQEINGLPTEKRIRLGIGYVPQEYAVFDRLSVRENLQVGALLQDKNHSGIARVLEMFPKLGKRLNQTAGTLSGGERKMLAVGRAILTDPKLLLLDEPTEGVWIGVIEEIADRLKELAREIAVVLVEQHLDLALGVAQYAYVLDRGRVVLEGSAEQVRQDPRLLEYLAP